MKLWVTTGRTESGDDVGPYVWGHKPTAKEVKAILRADWPEEFAEVGFVHHDTEAVELIP